MRGIGHGESARELSIPGAKPPLGAIAVGAADDHHVSATMQIRFAVRRHNFRVPSFRFAAPFKKFPVRRLEIPCFVA